jgi:hypothetical protein
MTSQSPRIYTYKITFEEVPYYYYGVHKEKVFDEEYWGTPVSNKWCWELYTSKKQILEIFEFSDEGYIEAQKVEGRLIRAVFNTDKWCLNSNCLGVFSLEQKSKAGKIGGKIGGKKNVESGNLRRAGLLGAKKGGEITAKKLNSQKWLCLESGMISTIGPLTRYQRVRGIDTSKRIKLE